MSYSPNAIHLEQASGRRVFELATFPRVLVPEIRGYVPSSCACVERRIPTTKRFRFSVIENPDSAQWMRSILPSCLEVLMGFAPKGSKLLSKFLIDSVHSIFPKFQLFFCFEIHFAIHDLTSDVDVVEKGFAQEPERVVVVGHQKNVSVLSCPVNSD